MNDDAMKEALDSLAEPTDPSTFTAANGLRLRLKRVSQMIIADANRRLKAPKPPVVFIEEKGRSEENPLDPGYIEATRHFQYDTAMLAMRVYYILGTEVIPPLPSDIEPPEARGWSDDILAVDPDADVPETGPRRYLAWLKLYALPDEDQMRLLNAIIRFGGGTLEVDVAAAQAAFRNNQARDSANGVPSPTENPSGNSNAEPSGNGSGIRGEGSSGIRALPVGQLDDPWVV